MTATDPESMAEDAATRAAEELPAAAGGAAAAAKEMQHSPPPDDDTAAGLLELLRHECALQLREFRTQVGRSLDGQVTGLLVRRIGQALRPAILRRDAPHERDADGELDEFPDPEELPAASLERPDAGTSRAIRDTLAERQRAEKEHRLDALAARFAARQAAREARQARLRRVRDIIPAAAENREQIGEDDPAAQSLALACQDTGLPSPGSTPPPELSAPGPDTPALPPGEYRIPSLALLDARDDRHEADPAEISRAREIIQDTIDSFGIDAEVGEAVRGPRVTLFEIRVARGVKVEAISSIANNLAMDLAATSLRILTPVPGHDFVGIEVPNRQSDLVRVGTLLGGDLWCNSGAALPLPMGRNVRGEDVVLDLAKAPHLLVAGATGSGKSVFLNSVMMSLLCRYSPEELQLLLIDPKVVEFSVYMSLPHLVVPVISEVSTVVLALRWVVREMERRYRLLAKVGVRNLEAFNHRAPDAGEVRDDDGRPIPARLPYMVLMIDELADIMMTARGDVETHLARIAQMSRAVGIHTIIATQRPSVNVITGVIKANYPARVAFQVASQVDARTIMDTKGAEALLGAGDMLYKSPGGGRMQRLQGALVSDEEIETVVREASSQGGARSGYAILKTAANAGEDGLLVDGESGDDQDEHLLREALEIIRHERRASTSYIQRRLRIGYNRAASIVETLEERGILGPRVGSGTREILLDEHGQQLEDDWEVDLGAS